ncbi:MAG: RidA family protein [Erysipelotrichaceae bacterium]|nr:RidA family protein [Erysipelotrichaceae bacterium]
MKIAIVSEKAPAAIGPYSQAIETDGLIFVSGQLPVADGVMPEDIAEQTKASLNNVKAILEAAGSGLSHVVKTTVFLKDMGDFAAMNEVYASFFTEPYPARACFEVAKLPKDAKVEIEAVAEKN